jgi:hypothetical protein
MKLTLDNVIRIVDETEAKTVITSETKKLILIDRKEKKAIAKKSFLDFRTAVTHFVVLNENSRDNVAKSEIINRKIVDRNGDLSIGFTLEYSVRCPVGNESRVAEKLFDAEGKTPGVVLEEYLVHYMHTFVEERYKHNPHDFCRQYPQSKEQMREYIETHTSERTSLRVEVQIKLDYENNLQNVKIDSHTQIMPCNCEEYIKLHYQSSLIVDNANRIYAIVYYPNRSQLDGIVEREIQSWIRQKGTMHDIVYSSPTLKSSLITHLNGVLSPFGRRIDFLTLSVDESLRMPEFKPLQHDVEAEIRQYGKVIVKNQFDIEPIKSQIVVFREMGLSDRKILEEYLKTSLERIIEKVAFNLSYIKVLTELESFQDEIRREFQVTANKIGYDVKLFSSIPNLEPIRLMNEGFTVNLSDGDGNTEFSTSSNFIKVKLDLRVSGKLKDLKIIENYLVARVDILDLMRNRIRDCIEENLLSVSPNDFYLHFDHGVNNEESVKSKIQFEVSQILNEQFGISISSIIPILLETELQNGMFALLKKRGRFQVNIASLKDNDVEFILSGEFRITNVDPNNFQVFLMQPASMEVIQEALGKSLESRLEMLRTKELVFVHGSHFTEMLKLIQSMAHELMCQQFGLIVVVDNIKRERSKYEEHLLSSRTDASIIEINKALFDKNSLVDIKKLEISNKFSDLNSKNEDILAIRENIRELRSNGYTSDDEIETLRKREAEMVEERDTLEKQIRTQISFSDKSLSTLSSHQEQEDEDQTFMPSAHKLLLGGLETQKQIEENSEGV